MVALCWIGRTHDALLRLSDSRSCSNAENHTRSTSGTNAVILEFLHSVQGEVAAKSLALGSTGGALTGLLEEEGTNS